MRRWLLSNKLLAVGCPALLRVLCEPLKTTIQFYSWIFCSNWCLFGNLFPISPVLNYFSLSLISKKSIKSARHWYCFTCFGPFKNDLVLIYRFSCTETRFWIMWEPWVGRNSGYKWPTLKIFRDNDLAASNQIKTKQNKTKQNETKRNDNKNTK